MGLIRKSLTEFVTPQQKGRRHETIGVEQIAPKKLTVNGFGFGNVRFKFVSSYTCRIRLKSPISGEGTLDK